MENSTNKVIRKIHKAKKFVYTIAWNIKDLTNHRKIDLNNIVVQLQLAVGFLVLCNLRILILYRI